MNLKNLILILFLICSCSHINKNATDTNETSFKIEKQSISTNDILDSIDSKTIWFKKDTKLYLSVESLPKDFIDFFSRFIKDSTFQVKHIKFPILAAVSECDSTILLTNKNWENFISDFRKDFYNPKDSNLTFYNDNKFYFERNNRETGLLFQIGFEKINGNWYLTLYMADVC